MERTFEDLGEDLIEKIFERLPAKSLAAAACVNLSWSFICNRILSNPKVSSAISFNTSLEEAVNELVDKVLSVPLRPQFVLASIGPCFILKEALRLIRGRFGSKIPIIINVAEGLSGTDVRTDKFFEVKWPLLKNDGKLPDPRVAGGLMLTVGYLPGMKAKLVPLFEQKLLGDKGLLVDNFVMDIREAAFTMSNSTSPAGIIIFAHEGKDIRHALQAIECAFPTSFLVGHGGCRGLQYGSYLPDSRYAALALILARDVHRRIGIGETFFHVMVSTGLSPVGPAYMVSSSEWSPSSVIMATRNGSRRQLGGEEILDNLRNEVGERFTFPDTPLYVGVAKERICSIRGDGAKEMKYHEFHVVIGGDEEWLYYEPEGIEIGDEFYFLIPDSQAALLSRQAVAKKLQRLKVKCNRPKDGFKENVFGCIVFSDRGRTSQDSSVLLETFPGLSLVGSFVNEEIAGGFSSHFCSCIYLVMSYRHN